MGLYKRILFSLSIIFIGSCGSNSNSSSETAKGNESTESSCLASLIENNEIEKMITAEQLAGLINEAVDAIEVKDNKSSSAKYSSVIYNWKADEDRMMIMEVKSPKAGGGTHVIKTESAVPNKVIVGNIELLEPKNGSAAEYFRLTYGPKTAEEKEAAKEQVDRSQKNSDKVDQKSADLIKRMVDKQNAAKVDGVGTLAYTSVQTTANVTDAILRVLHGNTMFKVTVDVSEDTAEDLALAKTVAQQIISNCK